MNQDGRGFLEGEMDVGFDIVNYKEEKADTKTEPSGIPFYMGYG